MRVKFNSLQKNEELHLTVDRSYIVYGLKHIDGHVRFLLVNDSNTYPNLFPSELFDIVDDRISKYWIGYPHNVYSPSYVPPDVVISFAEAQRPFFFDNLLDDEESASQRFKAMRRKMDLEFPDATLKTASIMEKNWIVCAYCEEVWESSSADGIVVCPQGHANNNPLWQHH